MHIVGESERTDGGACYTVPHSHDVSKTSVVVLLAAVRAPHAQYPLVCLFALRVFFREKKTDKVVLSHMPAPIATVRSGT